MVKKEVKSKPSLDSRSSSTRGGKSEVKKHTKITAAKDAKTAAAKNIKKLAKNTEKETANAKDAEETTESPKEESKELEKTKERTKSPKKHEIHPVTPQNHNGEQGIEAVSLSEETLPKKKRRSNGVHIKKRGKKYKEAAKLVDQNQIYSPEEALDLVLKTSTTKFDASVEVHIKLGIKTEQTEQNIRTVADLPEGTGKEVRVAAIVSSQKEKETKDADADVVGGDDLISKIEKGFLDFDIVLATPDMMGKVGKLGKVLGTKGLMPSPKAETVTDNPGRVIKFIKKGRVELRNDKQGIVHAAFGKLSFGKKKLLENMQALIETLNKAKSQSVKGQFIKGISISTTMGPGIKADIHKINTLSKRH